MRFSVPFVGQLAVLAVAALSTVACAPAVAGKPVQVMRSEAGVSSCEVVTTVRTRLYWTPMELKDPDGMAVKATKAMKEDASRSGANYLHVDSMDVPNNEAAATAYACPSTFKADLRSADVAFINFDGTKRTMNLPSDAPQVVEALPSRPLLLADTTVGTTTTTSAITPTSATATPATAAKTTPATAAASSTTDTTTKPKKKAGAAAAGAKKKGAATTKKKDAAKDAASDPTLSVSPKP